MMSNSSQTEGVRPTTRPAGVANAESDHRAIRAVLDALEAATELPAVRAAVEQLQGSLPSHFTDEEGTGGLFEELRLVQPALGHRLERLCEDHVSLKARLEGLTELVERAEAAMEELHCAKRAFVAHLRDHEESERAILVDAYYVDLGTSE